MRNYSLRELPINMKKKILKSSFVISKDASIEKAMGAITDNQRGSVVVVDESWHLRGIVSDGDIRRGMLRGATILTPVSKVVNMNPVTLLKNDSMLKESERIFEKESSINILPVVNKDNVLIDVIVRDPQKRKSF